ncbi:hypothetical protein [Chamaesiphon sp. VAR_48_metabat_135_sub]|uniref:hypothetical protein n=1 Tax=Chamaesiphon sp. VAR_48_metabat_135_sub TaxID=2964699 RepID=UPI00286B9AC4|nr:hypothetical protein [Chamaesiphon sp. VAR_48_metabat_135_sub]
MSSLQTKTTSNSVEIANLAQVTIKANIAVKNGVKPFSGDFFRQCFAVAEAEEKIENYFNRAIQNPTGLYMFFQRYTHFNAYTSAVIARLASSIAMSRYLFNDPNVKVIEEADRGFNLSAKVMIAASDEGTNDGAPHRTLAQLLLRTIGDYADLSIDERNQFANVPLWMTDICNGIMEGYAGVPGNAASLIRSMGFHAASELFGDIEYGLLDKVVRHDNKNVGFDAFLRKTPAAELCGHRYHPWCYVLIHASHEGAGGVEASHFECVVDALNLVGDYRPESKAQIMQWVLEGFGQFMNLEQDMFSRVDEETQIFVKQSKQSVKELALV